MAWRKAYGILFFALSIITSPAHCEPAAKVDAAANLNAAIGILKEHHLNRDRVDWPVIEAQAQAMITGKTAAAESYPAIRFLIEKLGEKHSYLKSAQVSTAQASGHSDDAGLARWIARETQLPESLPLTDRTGYLRIPEHTGSQASDTDYVKALREELQRFHATGVCRFIVDLRGNGGGNIWPMLNGLASLLGRAPYGYFTADKTKMPWDLSVDWMGMTSAGVQPVATDLAEAQANQPVAVLIDGRTISSGEFTAMAFAGRPNARSFGAPSAGYLTTNATYTLPDGATLIVSQGWATDRQERPYHDVITPDEQTGQGQATLDAAIAWLKRQPCH